MRIPATFLHRFHGLIILPFLALVGCAGSAGPDVLDIPPGRYEQAFNTALEVSRDHGMQPVIRDRRSGLIETDPVIAGTFLEPWYSDTADAAQGIDNTLSQYRMRARFEFLPAGFVGSGSSSNALGPDLLGAGSEATDLTRANEPLELRVWVYRERKHTVGQRPHTWSRRFKSNTRHHSGNETWEENRQGFWTPVSRDEAAEHRLLAQVAREMDLPTDGASSPPEATEGSN